jgi:hypothetical protein
MEKQTLLKPECENQVYEYMEIFRDMWEASLDLNHEPLTADINAKTVKRLNRLISDIEFEPQLVDRKSLSDKVKEIHKTVIEDKIVDLPVSNYAADQLFNMLQEEVIGAMLGNFAKCQCGQNLYKPYEPEEENTFYVGENFDIESVKSSKNNPNTR